MFLGIGRGEYGPALVELLTNCTPLYKVVGITPCLWLKEPLANDVEGLVVTPHLEHLLAWPEMRYEAN